MKPIKTILVAVDFGKPTDAALAYALDLAEGLRARLYLLHSYELPIIGLPEGAYVPSAGMAAGIIDAAQKALEQAVAKCDGRKVEVTPLLRSGNPRTAVPDIAKEVGADLIVMGTHGRRGIARAFLGSTTEGVVRTSEIPVLSVHSARPAAWLTTVASAPSP